MDSFVGDFEIEFERLTPLQRGVKKVLINPLANWFPSGLLRSLLRLGKSELAEANWADPGGWRSMVISYEGKANHLADRILVGCGTIPMALRNRKRLTAALLANLIDSADHEPVHILCLGAGPGIITTAAMAKAQHDSIATLVDLSNDAFDYGRDHAKQAGLLDRITFIQGDVRDVGRQLQSPPDIVIMIGICEYLTDEQIVSITAALADVVPCGTKVVFNSLSRRHGTDRFFRRVLGLNMIHRSSEQLQALMARGGFSQFSSTGEPLGVYEVVVGCRNGQRDSDS